MRADTAISDFSDFSEFYLEDPPQGSIVQMRTTKHRYIRLSGLSDFCARADTAISEFSDFSEFIWKTLPRRPFPGIECSSENAEAPLYPTFPACPTSVRADNDISDVSDFSDLFWKTLPRD